MKMAKYCTNCGKELKDGKCDCKKNEASTLDVKAIGMELWNLVKGMWVKPVDTMKDWSKKNDLKGSFIALGVKIIAGVFFVCILVKEMASVLEYSQRSSRDVFFGVTTKVEVPYLRIILCTIVTMVALYALMAGIAYVICNKLLKKDTSYQKMLVWLAGPAGMMATVYFVAALCVIINVTFGFWILLAGSILYLCHLYKGLSYACKLDENNVANVLMPTILLPIIIIGLILPRLFG